MAFNFDSQQPASSQPALDSFDMGSIATTHLMSDELVAKIQAVKSKRQQSGASELDNLKAQVKEYSAIYTLENTLSVLTFLNAYNNNVGPLVNEVAYNLQAIFKMDVCHIFRTNSFSKKPELSGSTYNIDVQEMQNYLDSSQGEQFVKMLRQPNDVSTYTSSTIQHWEKSGTDETVFYAQSLNYVLLLPLQSGKDFLGFVMLGSQNTEGLNVRQMELARATRSLLTDSLMLEQMLQAYPQDESADTLRQYRNALSEKVANLNNTQQWFVNALCYAIDASSHYTNGHSQGVAMLVKAMSEALGLSEKMTDLLHQAALVSVIGKLRVAYAPDAQEFPVVFSADDKKAFNQLTASAGELLRQMNFPSEVIPYVQYQQAYWNGEGMPEGLSGKSIPLGSRILGLATAYWALRHERPYRNNLYSQNEALDILSMESEQKWDPMLVELLDQIVSLTDW